MGAKSYRVSCVCPCSETAHTDRRESYSNQTRVWQEEKRVLEEKKKLQQLQKERAEERQIQELQRLQAAQGGKKVQERVEWLYAAPSGGTTGNNEELEQYLLGKKTVDKLFKEQDEKKVGP